MGLLEELETLQMLKPGTASNAVTQSLPDDFPLPAPVEAFGEPGVEPALAESVVTEPQFGNCLDSARRLVKRAAAAGSVA